MGSILLETLPGWLREVPERAASAGLSGQSEIVASEYPAHCSNTERLDVKKPLYLTLQVGRKQRLLRVQMAES